MNCPQCGAPTRAEAGFCGGCGTKLAVTPATTPQAAPLAPRLAPPPPPPPPPPSLPPQADVPTPTPAPLPPLRPAPPSVAQQAAPALPPVIPTLPPQPPLAPQVTVQAQPSAPPLPAFPPMPAAPSQPQPQVPKPSPNFAQDSVPAQSPAQPQPAAAHEEQPSEEDLDATRVSTRRPAKALWHLLMPDGSKVPVNGAVLIGRNPLGNAAWPNAQLLLVVDKTKSVSKTHVAVETDDDGLWVTDLASTNGVVVTYSDGREVEAQGSERLNVDADCGIELGRFIMLVEKN